MMILRCESDIQLGMLEESLKDKQVHQLLKLEELFHSQYLTEELLNELISLYVRFVQAIHNEPPLRLFFMEKIRFVLSRPEIIRILQKQSQTQQRSIRDTVRGVMGINASEQAQIKRMAEQAKAQIRQNHQINRKDIHKGELREKERSMKIQMQMRIMQEVQQNMSKLRKGIQNGSTHHSNQIKQLVNQQDQTLEQRRANRKKRLRKKSAQLKEVEIVPIEIQPIPREQLKLVQIQVQQTFQRFTRLTQSKAVKDQKEKENQGRVKFNINNKIYEEEEFAESKHKDKEEPKQPQMNFKKKSNQEKPEEKKQEKKEKKNEEESNRGTKLGRVTLRKNQCEEWQQQEYI